MTLLSESELQQVAAAIESLPGVKNVIAVGAGKGGVGKTSLSTATAIQLADAGLRVLLVSTDAASNLDEMLSVPPVM